MTAPSEAQQPGTTEPAAPRVMGTPRKVELELTSRCNLRCRYCFFFDTPEITYRDLPTEEWLQFFEELGSLGVMDVTLSGGEPFIRQDLPTLIESIVANRMRFNLLSNGGLIDDQVAAFIAGTGRCDYVQVSVDGSCAQVHDSGRGKGAFEGAMRGIRTLQRHGVRVAVRTTIHRHNVHDLENVARLLLEDLGLSTFGTNTASYFGSCRQNNEELALTIEERQLAMETLLRLNQKYGGRISGQAGPLANARQWMRMERARREGKPVRGSRYGTLSGCGCPNSKISIRCDGAIIPCVMLAHVELGRINQDGLQEVWLHSQGLNNLRRRRHISLTEFPFCADCPYVPYCTGNCPGLAYTLTGQVDHPSPDACLRQFLEDGGTLDGVFRLSDRAQEEARDAG